MSAPEKLFKKAVHLAEVGGGVRDVKLGPNSDRSIGTTAQELVLEKSSRLCNVKPVALVVQERVT